MPCECPAALNAHGGHRTWRCRDCEDAGWTTRRYDPPHPTTTDDITRMMLPLQATHDALARDLAKERGGERAVAELRRYASGLKHLETIRSTIADAQWRSEHGLSSRRLTPPGG
jgi:hypothetical protein